MRLKSTADDLEKHVLTRLVEGARDMNTMTQIIEYLDPLLDVFQARPSISIRCVLTNSSHRRWIQTLTPKQTENRLRG